MRTQATPSGGRYAEAGVDIDAGADLVDSHRPGRQGDRARRAPTRRWAASAGCSTSPPAASAIPCWLPRPTASAPRCCSPPRPAPTTASASTSSPCASTTWSCRARSRLFFLDYFATGKLLPGGCRRGRRGDRRGLPAGGMRADRRRDRRDAGPLRPRPFRSRRLRRRCRRARRRPAAQRPDRRGRRRPRPRLVGRSTPTASRWSAWYCASRASSSPTPAPGSAGRSLGDALLAPTRIYVASCLAAIAAGGVKALAHITGGGLVENPPRVLADGQVLHLDLAAWPLPPVFAWLARAGRLGAMELLRTFNCGIGMILVVEPGRVGGGQRARWRRAARPFASSAGSAAASGRPRVEFAGLDTAWPAAASPS